MRKYLPLIFIFCFTRSHAQMDPIDTDRPDQTESVNLAPKKWLQFEAGFNYQKNNTNEKEFITPTLLSKYGLCKWVELRLITTLATNSTLMIPSGTSNETGLDVTEIGAKIALSEEHKLFPKTSFIFHVGIPAFTSVKFRPDKMAPNFRFTMQHTLSSNAALGYNLGCEWDGYTNDPAYIYTLTVGINIAKKWYGYFEGFGAIKKYVIPEHNIDGGLAYFISNNFKIDISSGFGLTHTAPKWYIAMGASVRFKAGK